MLFQLVPNEVKTMWNEQVLRGLIPISIALHIVLMLLGYIRKHNPRTIIRTILWCVYILSYTVIPIALGITAQRAVEVSNTHHCTSKSHKLNTIELMSFWAPFLLLHLGGPDTITAYSLEDNKIWLRHFLSVVSQAGVAFYVLLLSWPGCSHLPILSVLVYVSGCIKCFERIQALRLANTENLRKSMLGPADPGPDYVKFLEELHLKRTQGFIVTIEEVAQPPHQLIHVYPENRRKAILEAYDLFQKFKRLFVDLILTYEDKDSSTSYFKHLNSSSEAFYAVETELGFAHDMLYTKATVVYTDKGLVLRATNVLLILLVLLGFCFHSDTHNYRVIDVAITYLLIAAEISKEIFAVVAMLRSDWTDFWLNQHNHTRKILKFPFLKQPNKQRWSSSIAQLDLLSVALEEKPASFLKDMIYRQFCEVTNNLPYIDTGSSSLKKNNCQSLMWSISDVEFDQSILIWHIATSLCYYSEVSDDFGVSCIESNHISQYLSNLLISNPEMLPKGIGMIRYRDTCAEAERFFKTKGPIADKAEACKKLLEVNCNELLPSIVKGDRSKSVLFDGCRLALALREIESREWMWKVVSEVWIEILGYSAANCGGFYHSQQLEGGGQLLTHVWLLMAHLGLTEHFQVTRGHARARFNVS